MAHIGSEPSVTSTFDLLISKWDSELSTLQKNVQGYHWRRHTRCVGCVMNIHNIFAHEFVVITWGFFQAVLSKIRVRARPLDTYYTGLEADK